MLYHNHAFLNASLSFLLVPRQLYYVKNRFQFGLIIRTFIIMIIIYYSFVVLVSIIISPLSKNKDVSINYHISPVTLLVSLLFLSFLIP